MGQDNKFNTFKIIEIKVTDNEDKAVIILINDFNNESDKGNQFYIKLEGKDKVQEFINLYKVGDSIHIPCCYMRVGNDRERVR